MIDTILYQGCLIIFSATVSLVPDDDGLEESEDSEEMERRNSRFVVGVVFGSFETSFPERLWVLDFRGTPLAFFGKLDFGFFNFLVLSLFTFCILFCFLMFHIENFIWIINITFVIVTFGSCVTFFYKGWED